MRILTHVYQDVMVGSVFNKGLSGGQKRRLTIAFELIKQSPVLFLDEPTSGIDSAAAEKIISLLQSLAKKRNMTIIISVHQPSMKIFRNFNKTMIVARGKLIYFGEPEGCTSFYSTNGLIVPQNVSPPDFFLV